MAEIKGFRALRYTPAAGGISSLICPPYDVISEDERRHFIDENEHNIIRLELPRGGDDPYAEAGNILDKWIKDGILAQDDADSIYVYEEEFEEKGVKMSFKGIICLVKLEEFSKGIILPHEETLSKAKADRFNLMKATGCNFSQIYSLYTDGGGVTGGFIDGISCGEPLVTAKDASGVTHRLWRTSDPGVISAVSASFDGRKLYIADGHHRYETAINYRNYLREQGLAKPGDLADYVMMTLVDLDSPGLVVYPTHRVVHGIENFDAELIKTRCKKYFDIMEYPREEALAHLAKAGAAGSKAFVLYTGGRYSLLTLKDPDALCREYSDVCRELMLLDVSVLHRLILEQIMGIDSEKLKNQTNLTYTRDIDEAVGLADGGADCAFILNPTKVTEIKTVALAGEKMPQKSTYFYPKLITGLVMNKII